MAEQMADYLMKGAVTNALNMASVSAEEAPTLKPYMTPVGLLGNFLGQVEADGITAVAIEFDVKAAALNPEPGCSNNIGRTSWASNGVGQYGQCRCGRLIKWHCRISSSP